MNEILPEKIPVYMPDADVKKFLIFQEHFEVFSLLVERGVFKQKNAAITLNFDSNGTLQTIQRRDLMYSMSAESRLGRSPELSTEIVA